MRRAVLASLAACALAGAHSAPAAAPTLPDDSVYQLDATLTDPAGRPMSFRDLRATPRLVTMFYAGCRYVCPLTIDSLKSIERELTTAERDRIGIVLISLDPENDTPERLAAVMSQRRLDAKHWLLLRPYPADLRVLAGMLGTRYRALADGEFNHTTALVLLDADGRILARSNRIGQDPEPEFLAAVREISAP